MSSINNHKKMKKLILYISMWFSSTSVTLYAKPRATPVHDFTGAMLLGAVPVFGPYWSIDVLKSRLQAPQVSIIRHILPSVAGTVIGTTLWYKFAQFLQEKFPNSGLNNYLAASLPPAMTLAARIYYYPTSRRAFKAFINRAFK